MTLLYKVLAWLNFVGLVIVLGLLASISSQATTFGAQSNWSGPINSANGFQVGGTSIVSSNRAASFAGITNTSGTQAGSGTNLTLINCANAGFDPGSLVAGASTSVDVAVTGATITSTRQVFFASVNTSTFDVVVNANASGTAGTVNVKFINAVTGTAAINLGNASVTVCMVQF